MHSFHVEKAEVIGLVEAEDLKPNDLVGVNKVSENFAVGGVYGHEMIWFKHVQTNVYQKKDCFSDQKKTSHVTNMAD